MCFKPSQLPYPKEPEDNSQTAENINIEEIFHRWVVNYKIPLDSETYFLEKVNFIIRNHWLPEDYAKGIKDENPGYTDTINGTRYIYTLAPYFSPGLIAHEIAHIPWEEGSVPEGFWNCYLKYAKKDKYIILLREKVHQIANADTGWKPIPYIDCNPRECHAEIYRYINYKMPNDMKIFYPKLL